MLKKVIKNLSETISFTHYKTICIEQYTGDSPIIKAFR